jgi:UDP-2,3-diacylglucosamine pyrophosphatase LpxH
MALDEMRKQSFANFDELVSKNTDRRVQKIRYGWPSDKLLIISDLHMGDGTGADDFKKNEGLLKNLLDYYFKENYKLILLGDIEEFHQAVLEKIFTKHGEVYELLLRFLERDGIYRIFGNHDTEWSLIDPLSKIENSALEAVILAPGFNGKPILVTHGHQAEEKFEKDLHIVRFGTTTYRWMERMGLKFDKCTALMKEPQTKDKIYSDWADSRDIYLICGHTHSPILANSFMSYGWAKNQAGLPSNSKERENWLKKKIEFVEHKMSEHPIYKPKEPKDLKLSSLYFNSGGGIFEDGITNIEIEARNVRLVFWPRYSGSRELLFEQSLAL